MPSSVDTRPSASLGALAQLSVGLTVCPTDDGYLVTAYRCHVKRDEQRVSFRITAEKFLEFADAISELAEDERSGEEGTDEVTREPVGATP